MPVVFVEPSLRVRLLLLGIAAVLVYGAATQVVWYRQSRPPEGASVSVVVVDDLVSHRDCHQGVSNSSRLRCRTDVTGIEFAAPDGGAARARTSEPLEVGDRVHVFRDEQRRWQVVEGHSRGAAEFNAVLAGLIALALVGSAWRAPVLRGRGSRVSPRHAGSPPPAT